MLSHHKPNWMKIQEFDRVNMELTKSVFNVVLLLAYLLIKGYPGRISSSLKIISIIYYFVCVLLKFGQLLLLITIM